MTLNDVVNMRGLCKRYRIRESDMMVLLALRNGETTPGKLSDASDISPAQMTRSLGRLEKLRMVVRRLDADDKRRWLMSITSGGAMVLAELNRNGKAG